MPSFSGVFPPTDVGFTEKEDAQYYEVEVDDNTMRSSSDGGYEFSRPRFTRKPRKTFTTGFTELSQSDYALLMDFWDAYQGAVSFTWVDPTDNVAHTVRMTKPPVVTYRGIGPRRMWNVEVTMKQV
jgi:phage-related protein